MDAGTEEAQHAYDALLAKRLQSEEDAAQQAALDEAASLELAAALQWEENGGAVALEVSTALVERELEQLQLTPAEEPVLMEGLLEKKPMHGFGMVERGLGIGWRRRRVVLRPRWLEWHHGDDNDAEPAHIVLDPAVTRVRASGDPGDDVELCLTVDVGSETLVLRMGSEGERDAWMRAIGRCVEKLKAAAFDALVAETTRMLQAVRAEQGAAIADVEAAREGVRLIITRFYSSCAIQTVCAAAAETFEGESDALPQLAHALAASLLSRHAEARLCDAAGARAATAREEEVETLTSRTCLVRKTICQIGKACTSFWQRAAFNVWQEESREQTLFEWQPSVARQLERAVAQLMAAWGGGELRADLAPVASFLDHVRPHRFQPLVCAATSVRAAPLCRRLSALRAILRHACERSTALPQSFARCQTSMTTPAP